MKKKFILVLSLFVWSTIISGCLYAVRYDGTYRGKVVDADTREPIEGAVVLGTWYRIENTLGGGVPYYYDARETVSDQNGNFSIRGQGLRIMSNLEPMDVLIFKAGYSYESGSWVLLKTNPYIKNKITWEGDRPVFQLKKLSLEDRNKQGSPDYPSQASQQKIKMIIKEINKDRRERGLELVN